MFAFFFNAFKFLWPQVLGLKLTHVQRLFLRADAKILRVLIEVLLPNTLILVYSFMRFLFLFPFDHLRLRPLTVVQGILCSQSSVLGLFELSGELRHLL